MDFKLACLLVFFLALVFQADAEFFFNQELHNRDKQQGLKCVRGQTVIRFVKNKNAKDNTNQNSGEGDYYNGGRRSHMNIRTSDASCQICVCSVEGKDEYCSKRPARNVNECLRMATITDEFNKNIPFDHERFLSFRIRRRGEYLWHNDEIPYDPDAKCKRGFSYYTNSIDANDTNIDVGTDVESLLDYSNSSICFFCVCSVSGTSVSCIPRDELFCEFYRQARNKNYIRDDYTSLFQQDRPAYFRQLSFRMRRTMDLGINEYVEIGGDSLCCQHQDGHRRRLQADIRNRVRQLRRKVPRENLLSGSPGGDYTDFIVNNDK